MIRRITLVCLLTLVLAACATQGRMQLEEHEEVQIDLSTFDFDKESMRYDLFEEYSIQPGDVLDVLFQIQTWHKKPNFKVKVDHTIAVKFVTAPELNEEQRIRPDGNISLPYIGEYYVIDKSINEIQTELRTLYARELHDPELYVVIPEFQEAIKELKKDLHTASRGLSRLVTVRPDGRVTFPLVGEVMAANKTIQSIADFLNENYEEILPGLHVDVFLQKHTGARVYVVGEVAEPGSYPIARPISVLQAMTLSKGYLPSARLDSIVVVRRHQDGMAAKRIDLKKLLGFGAGQEMFYLKPDDIVVVPKLPIAQAADISGYVMQAFMFKGWSFSGSYELHDAQPKESAINRVLGD